MKLRFSLRALLLVLTAVSAIGGYRLNERTTLQSATRELQAFGASLFYEWQAPEIVMTPVHVPNFYHTVEIPYTEKLPNGKTTTRTRLEIAHQNRGHTVMSESLRPTNAKPPGFQITSFLRGTHNDLKVMSISLPATSVNENTVELLSLMPDLERIVILVDPKYFSVKLSRRATVEKRADDLEGLGRDLVNAKRLIETKLPDITVLESILENRIAG